MDSVPAYVDRTAGRGGVQPRRSASVLVGRTLEQVFLREELAAMLGGRGRLVLLSGEAGIGKTALARDLTAAAGERGVRVLEGACFDLMNTPPYGPWRDLFDACEHISGLPAPPSTFAGGQLGPVTDQAALFADVRRFFSELSTTGPVLLLLEDLYWADPASLELLRHIAPSLWHWPILVIVTYRGDELTRLHPFAVHLPALVREADGLRLNLRRLDVDALRTLIASQYRLGRADEDRLLAYLNQHAEGNPLFATELLRALAEEGVLFQSSGEWALGKLDRVIVPLFLRQVIENRVARLGEQTRQALAAAAVIGQEVPLALWASVVGLDEDALLDIAERAVEAHLLDANHDGARVHFVHSLTREALYESILSPRRRTVHRRVAEAFIAAGRPDPDSVAFHLQAAGDPRAWEWLIAAGNASQRSYAWITAAERLRAALALLDEVEGDVATRCRLACRIGYLRRFSDQAGAIEAVHEARSLATQLGDPVITAEVRWLHGLLLCYSDEFQEGLTEMRAGIEALEVIPLRTALVPSAIQTWFAGALPAELTKQPGSNQQAAAGLDSERMSAWRTASLGRFLASAGFLKEAAPGNQSDLALLTDVSDQYVGDAAIAFASHALGIVHAAMGRPADARAALGQAASIFANLDHHALVAFARLNELADVLLPYDAAHPTVRRQLAGEAEAALDRTGGALRPGVSPRLAWLGCLVCDGRWAEADRILDDLPAPGNAFLRREITAARATLARHRGKPDGAWAEIRALLPAGPRTEPGDLIHQEGLFLHRLAADLCLDAGELVDARAWLDAHDRWLAWNGGVLGRAAGQLAWARFNLVSGDVAGTRVAATRALELATAPDQLLVQLAAHRLLGEIAAATKSYKAAEDHLAAALSLATACDVPFERALTLLALAELRLATERTGEAEQLLKDVRGACEPLGAKPTLARVDALVTTSTSAVQAASHSCSLTQRELDVLRLVADGRSDREIAVALFVGLGTVRTHLTSIFGKLGVGSRTGAVAAARRHGIV